jgi:hypothetical protein
MLRIVQPLHAKAGLGEQVRVASLATRNVEDAGATREREQLDQSRDLLAVADEAEDGLVLQQIVGVEVRRPPIRGLGP